MITSYIIGNYLNLIKDEDLGAFPMLSQIVFSPTLAFDPDLRKLVVGEDIQFQIDEGLVDWVGMMWSREPLRRSEIQGRRVALVDKANVLPAAPIAKGYNCRMADLQMNILLVSPSIYVLENVEEMLIASEPRKSFNTNFGPEIGDLAASVTAYEVTSLEKEDKTTYGTLATIGITATLVYHVIVPFPPMDAKLIRQIEADIYNWHRNDDVGELLSHQTIT